MSVVWNGSQYTITVRNLSGQQLAAGGKFSVLKDDASGNRSFVTSQSGVSVTQDLADGNTWQFNFPGPQVAATTKYIVVYQGTIGLPSGSTSDPVDKDIGIAAKTFTISPPPPPCVPISSLQWTQQGDPDIGSSFSYSAPTITFSVAGTDPILGGGFGRAATFESPGGCYLEFDYNISGDSGGQTEEGSIGLTISVGQFPVVDVQVSRFGQWSRQDKAFYPWPLFPESHTISVSAWATESLSISGTITLKTP